jgi:two-component system, cell cycle response regulator
MSRDETEGIRILIADNDAALQELLSGLLSAEGYGMTEAYSGDGARALFGSSVFEIAIIDVRLPDMNGLDLLREVKMRWPETEVIIITGSASLESAVEALRSGAYDYLAKPFDDLDVISAVVGRAAEKIRLRRENLGLIDDLKRSRDELEEKNRRLRELAVRDGLTGLHNHRHFQEALATEVERASRHGHAFSLIFIDVDHFKNYNDSHGHLEGDYLLRALATAISGRVRRTDLVARYGGEEFIVILPETSKTDALSLAEEVRRHIEHFPFHGREVQPAGSITVSIGVSSFPGDGNDAQNLIKKADLALYNAKGQGRNRVCG